MQLRMDLRHLQLPPRMRLVLAGGEGWFMYVVARFRRPWVVVGGFWSVLATLGWYLVVFFSFSRTGSLRFFFPGVQVWCFLSKAWRSPSERGRPTSARCSRGCS